VIEMSVTSRTLCGLETLIDDGLLEYAAMRDAEVSVEVEFVDDGSVTMRISQSPLQ
jgi:hypothetical protein